jgi:hypothetical protein
VVSPAYVFLYFGFLIGFWARVQILINSVFRRLETQLQPEPVDVISVCAADLTLRPPPEAAGGVGGGGEEGTSLSAVLAFSNMVRSDP